MDSAVGILAAQFNCCIESVASDSLCNLLLTSKSWAPEFYRFNGNLPRCQRRSHPIGRGSSFLQRIREIPNPVLVGQSIIK